MFEVQLVEVGRFDQRLLEFLSISLGEGLSLEFKTGIVLPDIKEAYDPRRQQFHSTEILSKLLDLEPRKDRKVLGLADVDLFIPIFTFVFGEAQLGGTVALMSTRRLRQEFYGMAPDETLLYRRAEKEAVHELGHTFGLVHCSSFECVMHFSNSIEEVDLKSSVFCDECARSWRLATREDAH